MFLYSILGGLALKRRARHLDMLYKVAETTTTAEVMSPEIARGRIERNERATALLLLRLCRKRAHLHWTKENDDETHRPLLFPAKITKNSVLKDSRTFTMPDLCKEPFLCYKRYKKNVYIQMTALKF